jgi:hypothetical protein
MLDDLGIIWFVREEMNWTVKAGRRNNRIAI